MAPIPIISSLVHYVSHGTPLKADGTQAFGSQCRAAIVAGIDREGIDLCVLNPSGIFFQKVQQDELTHAPGTCHWGTSFCPAEPKQVEASDPRSFAVPKMVEPVDPASLPSDLHALIDAVNQMREEWQGSTPERRKELWREMRHYADATWRLVNSVTSLSTPEA